jgi:hypothetical protein
MKDHTQGEKSLSFNLRLRLVDRHIKPHLVHVEFPANVLKEFSSIFMSHFDRDFYRIHIQREIKELCRGPRHSFLAGHLHPLIVDDKQQRGVKVVFSFCKSSHSISSIIEGLEIQVVDTQLILALALHAVTHIKPSLR